MAISLERHEVQRLLDQGAALVEVLPKEARGGRALGRHPQGREGASALP